MNNLKVTLAELLDTDNMTIYRNAISILKELQKQKPLHYACGCTQHDEYGNCTETPS